MTSQTGTTIQTRSAIAIPTELLEQVGRGNVLLFIGEATMQDGDGRPATERWAALLAARCGANQPAEYSFSEAAQAYEDEMSRHALVQFIRDELEQLDEQPQLVHRLIAELTHVHVLVTTCFDSRLERAFEEVGRPLDVIVGRVDVAFEDEEVTRLYKLRGSIDQIETLVLTEEDYERFFEMQASISLVLRAYLATKTILFIGYDLADPQFRNLYRNVTDLLDNYARRAYAFGTVPAQRVARWCKRHGIKLVVTDVTDFLEALLAQLPSPLGAVAPRLPRAAVSSAGHTATIPLPERPYKLLAHYEPQDAPIFFGRIQEIQTLASLIYAHRLVLLYALSGAGKTSLLLAGITPHLEQAEPRYTTLYVRGHTNPRQAIEQAMRRRLPDAELPQTGPLVDFLYAATTALGMPLVIFLDQFEEFFMQSAEQQSRLTFMAELGDLYDAREVPVKIVFSLREDWLAAMSEFEAAIPDLYRIKLRLLPLSRDQARQAITEPAQQVGIEYAPDLINQLLDDLAEVTAHGMQEQVRVMPPQLQLVCHALYERSRAQRRSWIALTDYVEIGGVSGILARYVAEALQEHPAPERAVAKALLLALVSAQATRLWATVADLTARTSAPQEVVSKVLARLVRQRLVRRLENDQGYELTHDLLATTVAEWIDDEERQLKRIQEMVQDELADWQQDQTIFPSHSKFQRINRVREHLLLTDEEKALLLRTALLCAEEVTYWLAQVAEPTRQVEILLAMLKNEAVQARQMAAAVLADFHQPTVAAELVELVLNDPESTVRDTAAVSLGRAGTRDSFDRLIDLAMDGESRARRRAVRALAFIQDVAPNRLPTAAKLLWRPLALELVQLRFWRDRLHIQRLAVVGAVGGGVSFASALTPLFLLQIFMINHGGIPDGEAFYDVLRNAPLMAAFSALFGLLAGTGLAFGIGFGEALWRERTALGRVLGGTILGGLSFTLVLSPLALAGQNFWAGFIGGGLFGMMIGFGITLPALLKLPRRTQLVGGMVGGALGLVLFALQFLAQQQVPMISFVVLLLFGGLAGLLLAAAIDWVEGRRSGAGQGVAQISS